MSLSSLLFAVVAAVAPVAPEFLDLEQRSISNYPPALSPDGRFLAAAASRSVLIWDLDDVAAEPRTITVSGVYSITFAPDGETLVLGTRSDIAIVNLSTEQVVTVRVGGRVPWVGVTSDGSAIAAMTLAPSVVFLPIDGNSDLLVTVPVPGLYLHSSAALDESSGCLIVNTHDEIKAAYLNGTVSILAPVSSVSGLALGQEGLIVTRFTSQADGLVEVLDLPSCEVSLAWSVDELPFGFALSPGQLLLFASPQLGLRVFDATSGELVYTLPDMLSSSRPAVSASGDLKVAVCTRGLCKVAVL